LRFFASQRQPRRLSRLNHRANLLQEGDSIASTVPHTGERGEGDAEQNEQAFANSWCDVPPIRVVVCAIVRAMASRNSLIVGEDKLFLTPWKHWMKPIRLNP